MISVRGSYDQCRQLESQLGHYFPWGFINGNLHPYATEGAKTVAFEITEQLGWQFLDVIVCPAASGILSHSRSGPNLARVHSVCKRLHPMKIASSPCNYGAWEATVDAGGFIPDPCDVLDAMSSDGYDATDLGSYGYFGTGDQLRKRLAARNLELAGGYQDLPFADPSELAAALPSLERLLDLFDQVASGQALRPVPTLADSGSDSRRAVAGSTFRRPDNGWRARQWNAAVVGVERAADLCRERGYEPAFHHHAGTSIETAAEIDRLLDLTDVGLCLDVGHLAAIGDDPLDALEAWGERITHVHIKDVRLDAARAIVAAGRPTIAFWEEQVFCPLGEGGIDLAGVRRGLTRLGYDAWIVLEQDTTTLNQGDVDAATVDQGTNLAFWKQLPA